jgi:multisubunit Na+/H+ antiporter MnhB subunit
LTYARAGASGLGHDRRLLPAPLLVRRRGSNVVNVLLVDFRSFDTLGEITVLAIVALTVYALLRRFRPAPESASIPPGSSVIPGRPGQPADPGRAGQQRLSAGAGIYLRLLLPFMGVIAVYFFMRGHNLPGGGFVAGLIFAVAILVQYMLAGTTWVESHMASAFAPLVEPGLLLACAHRAGSLVVRSSLPDHAHRASRLAAAGRAASAERLPVRPRRLHGGGRHHHADAGRTRPPVAARPSPAGQRRGGGDSRHRHGEAF